MNHFQYIGWPDSSYPESGSGMLDMIGQVQRCKKDSVGSVVVHCRYAGSLSYIIFLNVCMYVCM